MKLLLLGLTFMFMACASGPKKVSVSDDEKVEKKTRVPTSITERFYPGVDK